MKRIASFWITVQSLILLHTYVVNGQCPPGQEIASGATLCTDIVCADGSFYDAATLLCVNCDSTCSKCKFFSNFCSECKAGFYLYNQTCMTQCPQSGTYVSCLNGVCTCEACNTGCVQCFGGQDNQCLRCNSSYYFNEINSSCKKDCEDGYTKYASSSGDNTQLLCSACNSNCKTCSQANSAVCLTCKENQYLYGTICVDTCPDHYSKIQGKCVACPGGCDTCYGSTVPQLCLSCLENYMLDIESQACLSLACPTSFVLDAATRKCLPCHPSCKTCSNLTDEGCTQCQSGYSLASISPSKCLNRCADGNYSSNSACFTCNTSICKTCFGSGTNQCTSCQPGYFLYKTECVVDCPLTYYTYNRSYASGVTTQPKCEYCPQEMEQCVQDSTDLTKANPVLCRSGYYLEDNKCVKECKSHLYYASETDRKCHPCKFPCLTCLSENQCLTCATLNSKPYQFHQIAQHNSATGTTTYLQECVATCPDGYYSSNNVCKICNANCQTCSGPAETEIPMYGDKVSQNCVSCSSECTSCFKGDNVSCYSCKTGYYLEYLKTECKSFCSDISTYEDDASLTCKTCFEGCATCTDGAFNSCITCQVGYYLQADFNMCTACPSSCESCESSTVCTTCASGFIFLNGSCITSCPQYQYYSNGLNCQACHSSCMECSGSNNVDCISCYDGTFLSKTGTCDVCYGSCVHCTGSTLADCLDVTTCPTGQTLFNGQCITCYSSCGQCAGTTYDACTTCVSSSYSLLFDVCKAKESALDTVCDVGFFYDTDNSVCSSCHKNCSECTGKSSTQCSKCSSGYYLHSDITTCSDTCQDGYEASSTGLYECIACKVGCDSGCALGESILYGLCFDACPFGSTSASSKCEMNTVPELRFATQLGNKVSNNSQSVQIQVLVYALKDYSISWSLFEGANDVTADFKTYLTNRLSYVVFPAKSLKSGATYTIKASLFETSSICLNEGDCQIDQTFTIMEEIVQGSFDITVASSSQLTLILNGWTFQTAITDLYYDMYVTLKSGEYFFFVKGAAYQDQRTDFEIPNLSYESVAPTVFTVVVYNDYDVSIKRKSVVLSLTSRRALLSVATAEAFDISVYSDSYYSEVSTLAQIQSTAHNYAVQMSEIIAKQTSSAVILQRHTFYEVYYSLKGKQLSCNSTINCSDQGTCQWDSDNYNQIICSCNSKHSGRFCEFSSYKLDIARQHLTKLIEKFEKTTFGSQLDLFMALEFLVDVSKFQSVFDEFTAEQILTQYSRVFEQLSQTQIHISDEKILFKITRLTTQLIHLINEISSIAYQDQRALLKSLIAKFDTQISLFLKSFAESYDDLKSQGDLQMNYAQDIMSIDIRMMYENELLDAKFNSNVASDEDQSAALLDFVGTNIQYSFSLDLINAKQSLSSALIQWKTNPFLAIDQYETPFITGISRLELFSNSLLLDVSATDSPITIAIPKLLPTIILPLRRSYLQPYTCVYFDQSSEGYKKDSVWFVKENTTHIFCESEELSGNFGVVVNWDSINTNLTIEHIWNATSYLYKDDTQFTDYMKGVISNFLNNTPTDTKTDTTVKTETDDTITLKQLIYAMAMYAAMILLVSMISILRDKRDQEFEMKETDSYWLVHPLYSLFCGPYSTFFPRLSRSFNYCLILITNFLFNAIFVRVFSVPTEFESKSEQQLLSVQIGASSALCSIIVYYLTIGVLNLFKLRWMMGQEWMDQNEKELSLNSARQAMLGLRFYHLLNYGLISLLQIGMGFAVVFLVLTSDTTQSQLFFSGIFICWTIDNLLDILMLVVFCFIRVFSKKEKSLLILFFTLRGFFFPPSEFKAIESKIVKLQKFKQQEEEDEDDAQDTLSDESQNLSDDGSSGKQAPAKPSKLFKSNGKSKPQEEIQLSEAVNSLPSKW